MANNVLGYSASVSDVQMEVSKTSLHMARRAIMILGMHRSGTSAITGVLGKLGLALPSDIMGPGIGNENGHWEPEGIVALNDEILESAGSHWEDWDRFNPDWFSSANYYPALEKARLALKSSFGEAPLFLLKDPRICRFVSFWIQALKDESVEPLFLLAVRNPTSVAASLSTRDGMEHSYAYILWLRHTLEAESATRGRDRIICTFEQLLDDWMRLVSRIGEKLGIAWPKQSAQTRHDINSFLNFSLTKPHQVTSKMIPWATEAYSIFKRWADTEENPADYANIDSILDKFNAASSNFSDLILPGSRSLGAGGGHTMRQALEETQKAAAEMAEAAKLRECTLQQREEEVSQIYRERDEAIERAKGVEELEMKLAEAKSEIFQIEEDRQAHQASARRAELAIDNLQQKLISVEAMGQSKDAALTVANGRLSEIQSNLAEATKSLDIALAEKTAANLTQQTAQSRIGELEAVNQAEQARLKQALSVAESELSFTAANNAWLAKLNAFLLQKPRWWSLLPNAWRKQRELNALKRSGLFNAEAYLEMHSDVADADADPLQHYLDHGIREGRQLPN